ncbi:MAG: alpha-L-arabinofuranosidase [Opitutaceae bacterium]|nr:alpha-L-arabinofuranosidase [Opitutaceae bacterium]
MNDQKVGRGLRPSRNCTHAAGAARPEASPYFRVVASGLALTAVLLGLALAPRASAGTLESGFAQPPADTRPRTFWLWMNGNVTRDGITRDLEAMARIGLGGVMMFDGSTYLPAGPAGYLSPTWRELMTHAIAEGNRLGLDVGIHNAPGWSSSGGPWVTPAQAMQQLSWTETTVNGGRRVEIDLPTPQVNLGFYRDAFVIAFPALAAETTRYEDTIASVRAGDAPVPVAALSDGRLDTVASLAAGASLVIEFKEPVPLAALTVQPSGRGPFPRLTVETSLDGTAFTPLASLSSPGRHGILAPGTRDLPRTSARFVRATATRTGELAEFVLHRTPRLADWPLKANFDYRVGGQLRLPGPADPAAVIDPATVVDVSAHVRDGRLTWDAPPGAWTILRVGHTPTGKEIVAASAAGRGLEIDKFDPAAAEFHFNHVVMQVRADAAAAGLTGPTTLTIDSYEVGMQNWTAAFPAEFRRRAGYDIQPYAPALFGRFVGDAGVSERFLADVRRVQADLIAENYYERMRALAHAQGMRFFVEGYGPSNFDELRVAGLPDVPTTEFWVRTPWTPNRTVKMVTSAAHIYGKPVVAAESYTGWTETSRWLEYPYALKTLGDEMFAHGMNLMVFHRYVHQPHPDAAPGMTMGPYGMHFERTATWFEQAGSWIEYLQRCHWMLQQGTYAADVLVYTGERSPDPSSMVQPVVPPGYTYDLVNTDVLLTRVTVTDGAYVLPEGGRYRLLVLPPGQQAMRPDLVHKLRAFVDAGATILGPKPVFSATLAGYPQSEREMLAIADALWDPHRSGPGRVITSGSITDALIRIGATPDITYRGKRGDTALAWQHRVLPEGDLYFLANRQRQAETVEVSFRGMAGRRAELWHPETGARREPALLAASADRALLPLQLDPAESVFVLFRRETAPPSAATLRRDGEPLVGIGTAATPPTAPAANFTMALWVKPDTDLRAMPRESTTGRIDEVGKFYAITADPGDLRFGPGHATAGLAVGRNGIYVVERSSDTCPAVLVSDVKVAGWAHVAVVYRDGRPRLFVDGTLVREGLVSGRTVHSGVGSPLPPVDYTLHFPAIESLARASGEQPPPSRGQAWFFEGNSTPAESFDRALSDTEVAALAARGLPPPPLPVAAAPERTADGAIRTQVWQSGAYSLDGGAPRRVEVEAPREIAGPWTVAFQEGRGAPASIQLPQLISLHRHADPGVRYFSGTATYQRTFDVPAAWFAPDRRVVLDLGRVEVIAELVVNGTKLPPLWKEPYRADITTLVRAGANTLEVRVTNLWPNRLIGDEELPAEDEFGLADERGQEAAGIKRLPDWYLQGKPKPPGGRVTFAAWKFFQRGDPLLASGLLGPVRLLNPVTIEFAP